jgi:hypothetical protein
MSNQPINFKELAQEYPELEDIANRLADSEKEADEYNRTKKGKSNELDLDQTERKKPTAKKTPEHAVIARYWKSGQWIPTAMLPKSGRENFEDMVSTIANRAPGAFEIHLFNGRKQGIPAVYKATIYMKGSNKEEIEKHNPGELGNTSPEVKSESNVAEAIKNLEEKLALQTKNPAGSLDLINANFEKELMKIRFQNEMSEKKRFYEDIIAKKDQVIVDLQGEIEDLEAELDEGEELAGIYEKKLKEEHDPGMGKLIEKVGSRVLKTFLMETPKFTEALTGLSKEELNQIWEEDKKRLNQSSSTENSSSASFSEVEETDPLEAIIKKIEPEEKAKAVRSIIQSCTIMPFNDFKMLYHIWYPLIDDKGGLVVDLAKSILAYLQVLQDKKKEEAEKNAA